MISYTGKIRNKVPVTSDKIQLYFLPVKIFNNGAFNFSLLKGKLQLKFNLNASNLSSSLKVKKLKIEL